MLKETGISPADVAAVSTTCMREGILLYDKDGNEILTAFQDAGEDVAAQAAPLGDGRIPVAALQIEQAGSGTVARLDSEHPGEFIDQPVVEHTDRRRLPARHHRRGRVRTGTGGRVWRQLLAI